MGHGNGVYDDECEVVVVVTVITRITDSCINQTNKHTCSRFKPRTD